MDVVLSPRIPSERRFGLTLATVFLVLSVYEIIGRRTLVACGAWVVASAIFGVLALTAPRTLEPLNRAWFYLGERLGKIVSPIVLGIMFFGFLTPLSVMIRLCGRDELRLRRRPSRSYWINRSQPGPTADSFKNPY